MTAKKNATNNATPKKAANVAKAPKSAKPAKHAANAATTANTANDTTTNKPAKKVAKNATTDTAPTNDANDATPNATTTTANEPSTDTANTEPAERVTQELVTPVTNEPPANRLSALDAAALVLAKSPKALTPQELIGVMAVRKLWFSPGGKTPAATLYSAITREIATKGTAARFTKAAPGRFTANTANANTTANDDGEGDDTGTHAAPAEEDDPPFSENDVYRL